MRTDEEAAFSKPGEMSLETSPASPLILQFLPLEMRKYVAGRFSDPVCGVTAWQLERLNIVLRE